LSEELTKRGFFVATEHAPENCVGICGIKVIFEVTQEQMDKITKQMIDKSSKITKA